MHCVELVLSKLVSVSSTRLVFCDLYVCVQKEIKKNSANLIISAKPIYIQVQQKEEKKENQHNI